MSNEQASVSLDDQWGAAMAEASGAEGQKKEEPKPASFAALKQEVSPAPRQETGAPVGNIDMILDIPVTLSVEIGRARMMVKDLLQLSQGTVVELEKLAGEPMEILVNGRLVARGEAVVINEKFGIKLTDIVSPTERINKLR